MTDFARRSARRLLGLAAVAAVASVLLVGHGAAATAGVAPTVTDIPSDGENGAEVRAATASTANDSRRTTWFLSGTYQQVESGDVAEFAVRGDRETLALRGDGYRARAAVVDGDGDDEVRVRFNTFVAASAALTPSLTAGDPDDRVTVIEEEGTVVARGTGIDTRSSDHERYEVRLSPGLPREDDGSPWNESVDRGALTVVPRSTNGLRVWRAPARVNASSLNASELRRTRGGPLTRAREAVRADTLVFEVNASGLEGPIARRSGNASAVLLGGNVTALQVRNMHLELLQVRETLTLSPGEARVVPDAANDTYYVVADLSTVRTNLERAPRIGDHRATFEVPADSPLRTDAGEPVVAEFELVEPTATLDGADAEPLALRPSTGAQVAGETTLAPGANLSVVVRDDEGSLLARDRSVRVDDGGRFTATIDLTGVPTGRRMRVTVRRGADRLANASAVVRAGIPTATARPGGTATATDGVRTDRETTATGPGLGVGPTLVALVLVVVSQRFRFTG